MASSYGRSQNKRMKRSELLVSTLLVPLDALAIFGAFVLSYYVRVESGALQVSYAVPFERYLKISLAITAVWVVIFALLGLYNLRSTRRGLREFSRIFAGITIGTLVVIAVIFFLRIDFFSRFIILFGFAAGLVLVTLARTLVRVAQRSFFRYGIGVRRAVVIGTDRTAQILGRELTRQQRGYVILGYLKTGAKKAGNLRPLLGNVRDLPKILARLQPDELIDADPSLSTKQKLEFLDQAEDAHVDFRFASDSAELVASRVQVAAVAGIPLMTVQRTPLEGWGRITKRTTDIAGSLAALVFVTLAFPFIALAIKSGSRGPVLFKQRRVGKEGREFTSYKFRTMVDDAEKQLKGLRKKNEASGPVFKIKNDPRITKVGRFLRKTSLDEVPQFWNVLKGDMSLVGPRPPLPSEVKQYDRTERRRLTVKPGITGPWQVSGRSDVSFDEWVKLDLYYIQNWSLLLDLTILLKTVAAVLSRRGAY